MNFRKLPIILIAVGLVMLIGAYGISAAQGINQTINFQGKVVNKTSGTNITNGNYSFTFSIYDQSSGGTALWTETKTLSVTNGIFQTLVGDTTPISGVDFNTDTLYLGINFNSDGEMAPRVRLAAVPYAFNAQKVAGLTVTNTTGTLTIPNGQTIQFGDSFTTSGAFPLTLTTTASTSVTLPTSGTLSTLAGAETFTNKTVGSTGLIFSGASTDIDTAAAEGLVIQGRAASTIQTTAGALTFQPGGTGTSSSVQIGAGSTGSATPDFLGLDVYNGTTSTDPSGGFEGAMYYHTTDNKFRCYVDSAWTDCGGTGSTWTIDADADGYDLNDLSNLLFRETTGAPGVSDVELYRDNSGDLTTNVLSGKTFNISVNGTDEFNFSSTGLAMNSNSITGLGSITSSGATLGATINGSSTGTFQIGTGSTGSSTPDFFGLDVYNGTTGTDPSGGFEGAMYYHTTDNKFRCYLGSGWTDCEGSATGVSANSLDFDEFENTLDLDAALTLNQGTNTWTQNFTGTTTTGFTFNADNVTSGKAAQISVDALQNGTGLEVSSTSTGLTTGSLARFDWSPGLSTTASGDLFSINVGASGTADSLFNVSDSGISLFKITEGAVISAAPSTFSSASGLTVAYNLLMTNQTASSVVTNGPFTIDVGDSGESNNLTLKTYNTGIIRLDGSTVQVGQGGAGSSSPGLFNLDVKSDAGDPTGVNGSMYYNENTDVFRCYENGAWKDCDTGAPTRVTLGSDVINNNGTANTIADVTGLSFSVTNGTRYKFRFFILYTSAATTTGSRWSINGPTTSLLYYQSRYTLTATTQTQNFASAYNIPTGSNASSLTTGNTAVIEGVITPSANGTVVARFASEVSGSAITAKAGSYVEYFTY